MSGGFQSQVYDQPAAFLAGDRVSQNPIASYLAGPGGLVAGSSLFVGRFAWVTPPQDPNGTYKVANSFGWGKPAGFLMRNQQALNTTFLSPAGNQVQQGFQTALQIAGDFAVVNDGSTVADYGDKAFAYVADGKVAFAPPGTVFGGASATGSDIAQATFSVTGSVSGAVMTVTAVGSGTVVKGASIAGTGISTGPAPKVVAQLTGTPGGVGTYQLNQGEMSTAAGITISGTYGLLTIGTATGTFGEGDVLTGSGITAQTILTQILTGAGGSGGTAAVDVNTVVNSTTITASVAVETGFYARSTGLPGSTVKISSYPNAGGAI